MRDPLLTEFELSQSGVQKILQWFDARLENHRVSNDDLNASLLLRGRIAEIKDLGKAINPKKKTHGIAQNDAMSN